ncbi:long-chain fatty acid transport protein 4-like [Tigriopus californicus]|nr:long-chain fatty acid transport protein 4-like [Tigriopus californicus]
MASPYRYGILAGLAAGLYFYAPSLSCGTKWFILLGSWLASGGYYICYLAYHTLGRDLRLLKRGIGILTTLAYYKYMDKNVIQVFRSVVKKSPKNVMLVNCGTGQEWSYSQVDEYSNKVANYLLKMKFKKGDTVAFFMENRPEYIATWLGMAKIGVIPALINYNLRNDSLYHTIQVAGCSAIIYGLELDNAVSEVMAKLMSANGNKFPCYYSLSGTDLDEQSKSKIQHSQSLDQALKSSSSEQEPLSVSQSIHSLDPLLYIYTSGTTGLPKAVIIKHIRQLFACIASIYTIGLYSNDVVYCHLPLYHSSGGQVATSAALFLGTKTVIRKKFSASNFWTDCIKYDITATQYIGEIARYLLTAKSIPEEKMHKIRIMFGNGLRPQIWKQFVDRFNIPNIAEFYGATEGNSNIINIENRVGSVGFIGVIFPDFLIEKLLPLSVIKIDQETGEPIRGSDGRCIKTEPNEPGEFIGKIVRGDPVKDFDGYKDSVATKKKILTDVFKKGDVYFRSGDILIRDKFGYLYFKDRQGDTFRWKGENVSTTEVEANVSEVLNMLDAISYGVEIPNTDGRAGMIALPAKDAKNVDLNKLHEGLRNKLPSYAVPMFVRLVKEIDMTGTYKLKKNNLQKEGYDVTSLEDAVFFLDARQKKYVPLTKSLYQEINDGKVRL